MKRQRSPALEVDLEDKEDEFQPLFDSSQTMGPAPILLSDVNSDDDIIITSGPPQLKPKVSPAQKPPTPTPQNDPARKAIVQDDDDDDDKLWLSLGPLPARVPSSLPSPGDPTLHALRSKRLVLQQSASPEALRKVEEKAVMQAKTRPEADQRPLSVETPNCSKAHGKSPMSEAELKETILINVQAECGDVQPFRMFKTDTFELLFKVYAERVAKVYHKNLIFRFHGDQLSPNSTPDEHDMEDGELIEVYPVFWSSALSQKHTR